MPKHTPNSLRKLATDADCTLDMVLGGRTWQILLDAPPGKLLVESGCHCSAAIRGNGFHKADTNWEETAEDIQRIIDLGFEDCDDPDCDVCDHYDNEGV